MSGRVYADDPVNAAIAAEGEARRAIRCHRDGMARPDELLHSLLNVLEADGRVIAPTAGLRAWCRTVGKALEGAL